MLCFKAKNTSSMANLLYFNQMAGQYYENGGNQYQDDLDETELNNEFNNLNVYDKNGAGRNRMIMTRDDRQQAAAEAAAAAAANDESAAGPVAARGRGGLEDEDDDESKGQQVWQRLQKAAANKNSGGGGTKKRQPNSVGGSGFGSSNSNHSLNGTNVSRNNGNGFQVNNKKPPLPAKPELNYIEKNMEAIRNKENLTHRYPEKKYEIVHGKNLNKAGQR